MADNSADVNLIMNIFKTAAEDYSSKTKITRNTAQTDNNEVSPALTHALRVLVENILEREDSIKQDFKINFMKLKVIMKLNLTSVRRK